MTFIKILFYILKSAFTFKYRIVSIELSKDGKKMDVLLWGVATETGWKEVLRPGVRNK